MKIFEQHAFVLFFDRRIENAGQEILGDGVVGSDKEEDEGDDSEDEDAARRSGR